MNNQTPAGKASLFDLYPQDFEALAHIRESMDLNSNALAVRLSIRSLAKRLNNPARLSEPEGLKAGTKGGE